jgi:hypothetical protein
MTRRGQPGRAGLARRRWRRHRLRTGAAASGSTGRSRAFEGLDLAAAAVVGVVGAVVVVVVLGGGLPRLLELCGFLPLVFAGVVEDFADDEPEDFAVVEVVDPLWFAGVPEDGPLAGPDEPAEDGVAAPADDGPVVVVDDAEAAWACVIWM